MSWGPGRPWLIASDPSDPLDFDFCAYGIPSGPGLCFAFTIRPGGLWSPQSGGFCERAAFWGDKTSKQCFFHCVLPKKPYAPLTVLFPLCHHHLTPQKATLILIIDSTTGSWLFEESDSGDTVEKELWRDIWLFGEHTVEKSTDCSFCLLKKPPSRKSYQFEET